MSDDDVDYDDVGSDEDLDYDGFDDELPDDDDGSGDDADDAMDYGLKESSEIRRVKSFEVLSETDLLNRSKQLIESVKEVLGLPHKSAAILLLRYFKYVKVVFYEISASNAEFTTPRPMSGFFRQHHASLSD